MANGKIIKSSKAFNTVVQVTQGYSKTTWYDDIFGIATPTQNRYIFNVYESSGTSFLQMAKRSDGKIMFSADIPNGAWVYISGIMPE